VGLKILINLNFFNPPENGKVTFGLLSVCMDVQLGSSLTVEQILFMLKCVSIIGWCLVNIVVYRPVAKR
jgi:hypothetical protein